MVRTTMSVSCRENAPFPTGGEMHWAWSSMSDKCDSFSPLPMDRTTVQTWHCWSCNGDLQPCGPLYGNYVAAKMRRQRITRRCFGGISVLLFVCSTPCTGVDFNLLENWIDNQPNQPFYVVFTFNKQYLSVTCTNGKPRKRFRNGKRQPFGIKFVLPIPCNPTELKSHTDISTSEDSQ